MMEQERENIKEKLPTHVAIIMDGNGRWAKEHGLPRVMGHHNGVKVIRKIVECASRMGIKYLTLYAFSIENWKRPQDEVNALMSLFVDTIKKETETLLRNNIRLSSIGDLDQLPAEVKNNFAECIRLTHTNTGLELILAISYSARWDIVNACRQIVEDVQKNVLPIEKIEEQYFATKLSTGSIPDPDLLIRTSGEKRLSNFLLWQLAYSELYFSSKLWPDFTEDDFNQAIINYKNRERRFGKISEQIQ